MSFNTSKCIVLHIAPRNKKILQSEYKLHGHILQTEEASSYLGVTISDNLIWDKHIHNITNKGNRTFRLHKKEPPRIHSPGESGYLQMYKAMVRPSLEYPLTVWDSPSQADISTVHIHAINCGLKSVRLTKI